MADEAVRGKKVVLYLNGVFLAYQDSVTINISKTFINLLKDDDGFTRTKPISKSYTIDFSGLIFADEFYKLNIEDIVNFFVLNDLRLTIKMEFETQPGYYKAFRGYGYISSLQANADYQGISSFSGNFKGDGGLTFGTL